MPYYPYCDTRGAVRRVDAVARCDRPCRRRVHDLPAGQTDCTLAVLSRNQRSVQHIVFAHEARDKSVGWIVINLFGAADLLNPPVSKDGDAVGQGQRFTLIVRDIEDGEPERALDALDRKSTRLNSSH